MSVAAAFAPLAFGGVAGALNSTLYVSPTGNDSNACTSPGATACLTLHGALSKAVASETINVAKGTYLESPTPTKANVVKTTLTGLTIKGTTNPVVTAMGARFGLVVNANDVTVEGLTFQHAFQSGVLVSPTTKASTPTSVTGETISTNVITANDRCSTTNLQGTKTNCSTPTPFSDYGEGLHLMSVATSTVSGNKVSKNWGGILVTDELGPSHTITITKNTSSTNLGDCGVTLASHNTKAFTKGTSKPDPTAGGVFTLTVTTNHANNNGAAGLLDAGGPPGTAVYHNIFSGNAADNNGLAGFTLHSHAPMQDLNTNVVTDNTFVHDALHGLAGGPGDAEGPPPSANMGQSAGIQILGAIAPVTGTVIKGNKVATSFYGIWLSPNVGPASTIATNAITVTSGGTAVYDEPSPNGGYVLAGADGGVFAEGNLGFYGSRTPSSGVVGVAETPDGGGYWLASSNGTVHAYGDAQPRGTLPALGVSVSDIVGIATTPDGGGYWLVASDGGVFAFGNAPFFGSMGGKPLNKPVVGIASAGTPTSNTAMGYWLVASDGGIFSFGSAGFYGSMGGKTLNKPMVGIAAAPTGKGYWTVASDGGIFAFGTATFHGSMGGKTLNKPMVAMAAAPTGKGYWTVASDGGIFALGTAHFAGALPGHASVSDIVGMATNPA